MNGTGTLQAAARTLREHTDSGWVALRDDVVAAAVRAFRPSAPIRGQLPGGGELWVTGAVLVERARTALDDLPDAAPLRITCTTGPEHDLERLTIELVVLYGTAIVPAARRVRTRAAEAVAATLGLARPPTSRVHVDVAVLDVAAGTAEL